MKDARFLRGGNYLERFLDTKKEKTVKRAFSQSIIISIISLFLCIAAFCSLTYAWFSGEAASRGNNIVSGTFDLDVSVVKKEEDISPARDIEVVDNGDILVCELPEKGTYTVTLTRVDGSTTNGYCYVTVGSGETQATEPIVHEEIDGENGSAPFVFYIVTQTATTVKLQPRWGMHASPLIFKNDNAPVARKNNE